MPTYDYKCSVCGYKWDMMVPMSDYKEKQMCPNCKGKKSESEEENKTGEKQITKATLINVG